MMLFRRSGLLLGALAATLASTTCTAAPAGAAVAAVPSGSVTIINHAHTNYLIPDDGVGNAGTYLQVYYNPGHPFPRTFTFEAVGGQAGVYRWKHARGTCAETQDRGQAGTSVALQNCGTARTQWWFVRPVTGSTDLYVISPYNNEGLAVTGTFGDDNWAPLRELPGPDTATASQQWHLNPR
jgi:hypothetical protein